MTKIDYTKDYIQYANDAINGDIVVGEYIRLSCQRFLSWFDRDDIFFDYEGVDKRIRLIEKMKASNGKQLILMDWQKFCLAGIFGFLYTDDPEQRVVNNVLMFISRKCGKTAFASAIALSCILMEKEPSQEVYMIANSSAQATICMNHAKFQAHSLDKKEKLFKQYRNYIEIPKLNSYVKVLSSDTSKLDGLSPSCFIVDEIHEMRNFEPWNILKTGAGARKNGLGIGISTAGFHLGDTYPCYSFWQTCIEILRGVKQDDTWFCALFQLDEDDDWTDESVWKKAIPSLGHTISYKYIREQVQSAINNTSLEVSIRTKNLNQWMNSSNVWITENVLTRASKPVNLADFKYETSFMGIDLSSVGDLTCWSLMFPPNNLREVYPDKYVFKSFIYIPEEALKVSSNKELYKEFIIKGYAIKTSGNVVDYDFILRDMLKNVKDLTLYEVAYDSYNATSFAIDATQEGLPLVPYSQSLANFNIPTKSFERLILSDKVVLDSNPATLWMFRNIELKFDHNDNCKPYKSGGDSNNKIDVAISCLEALGSFLHSNTFDPKIFVI